MKGFELKDLNVLSGTSAIPTATIKLERDGKVFMDACCGKGPIDAAFQTIDRITGLSGRLLSFSLEATAAGRDALGKASVQVAFNGKEFSGTATSVDIIEASVAAYISCVNQYFDEH